MFIMDFFGGGGGGYWALHGQVISTSTTITNWNDVMRTPLWKILFLALIIYAGCHGYITFQYWMASAYLTTCEDPCFQRDRKETHKSHKWQKWYSMWDH